MVRRTAQAATLDVTRLAVPGRRGVATPRRAGSQPRVRPARLGVAGSRTHASASLHQPRRRDCPLADRAADAARGIGGRRGPAVRERHDPGRGRAPGAARARPRHAVLRPVRAAGVSASRCSSVAGRSGHGRTEPLEPAAIRVRRISRRYRPFDPSNASGSRRTEPRGDSEQDRARAYERSRPAPEAQAAPQRPTVRPRGSLPRAASSRGAGSDAAACPEPRRGRRAGDARRQRPQPAAQRQRRPRRGASGARAEPCR